MPLLDIVFHELLRVSAIAVDTVVNPVSRTLGPPRLTLLPYSVRRCFELSRKRAIFKLSKHPPPVRKYHAVYRYASRRLHPDFKRGNVPLAIPTWHCEMVQVFEHCVAYTLVFQAEVVLEVTTRTVPHVEGKRVRGIRDRGE